MEKPMIFCTQVRNVHEHKKLIKNKLNGLNNRYESDQQYNVLVLICVTGGSCEVWNSVFLLGK